MPSVLLGAEMAIDDDWREDSNLIRIRREIP
jgi:hypothetical protein